jgi:hypothetical protein
MLIFCNEKFYFQVLLLPFLKVGTNIVDANMNVKINFWIILEVVKSNLMYDIAIMVFKMMMIILIF